MLAPQPFLQPRGTPISIYFRIRALSELGHKVDLITYHLGEDVRIQDLKILRIPDLFFIRRVKIGPSFIKVPLDFLLFFKALFQLTIKPYDLLFSHEEAAWPGAILAKIWRMPHIYDMHSSLPDQLETFTFSHSKILKKFLQGIEKYSLKNSHALIVICLDLLKKAEKAGYGKKAILLENFLDFINQEFSEDQIQNKKRMFAPKGEKIILYTGNFEPYQGIPLLLKAAAKIKDERVFFLLVGGSKADSEKMRRKAEAMDISHKIIFAGEVIPSEIPLYISIADVLVSPRLLGTNTPLKIYSFLKSGKPVVATNLWAHTQVLGPENAVLVDPNPQSLADGICFSLGNTDAQKRAHAAKELAEKKYTYPRYLEKVREELEKACHPH
ncbi:MAG: glycosyltransferase [Candidatus Aminicenantes bacterium]|nr:MAG: glycosyltransferase [Candidatus Aminicenantes bacterium]